MRTRPTRGTQLIAMRGDVRYVERRLHELTKARETEVLDIDKVRQEVQRSISAIAPEHVNDALYQEIDKLVDTYVSEFVRRMRARHHKELDEFGHLKTRLRPYLDQVTVLMEIQTKHIGDRERAATHAMDRLSDGEAPLVDPRHQPKPPKGASQ